MSDREPINANLEASLPFSRRTWLKAAAVMGFMAALTKYGLSWVLQTPQAELPPRPESESDPLCFYPATLERQVRGASFFETDKGHFPYLHALAQSDFVRPLVHSVFKVFIEEYLDRGQRLGISSAIEISAQHALPAFSEWYPETPEIWHTQEIMHFASIILATIMGKWDSMEQAEEMLDYPLRNRFSTLSNVIVDTNSLANQLFPRLFGGADKSMHFMQYFYLSYEYLYLLDYLPQAARFPRFWELPVFDRLPNENKARVLFSGIGDMYELRSTFYISDGSPFSAEFWRAEKERLANEGIFDNKVIIDLVANSLGVETAILIQRRIQQGMTPEEIIAELRYLDDPGWQHENPDVFFSPDQATPARTPQRARQSHRTPGFRKIRVMR